MNLADDFFVRMRQAPDRQALAFEDGARWTYETAVGEISARARVLKELGVGRGDRVALCLHNGPECVFFLYACWTIGASPVSVSPLYGPSDLAGSIVKSSPRLAVVDRGLDDALAVISREGLETVSLDDAAGNVKSIAAAIRAADHTPVPVISLDADAESSILFTGGTTGTPKAVISTHGGTLAAMGKLAAASKNRPGPYEIAPEGVSPNLVALPLFHSGGQQALLFSYHVGRSVVLLERFRPDRLAAAVAAHAIDNLFLLPTMVFDLAHYAEPIELASVRSVLVAGGALDPETRAVFERRFQIPMFSNYGSTEIGHVAGWTAHDIREGRWKAGSAGRIYPGVEVEIRDDDGTVLPTGELGEICVRTNLTKGYAGNDGSDAIHIDGWVLSGDLGYVDADNVLFLAGRKRELIKCGGFQVWPAEVEDVLRTHPLVGDVAVVGRPDARLGQIPKAYVVPRDPRNVPGDEERAQLIAHAREHLAHYKAVREVDFISSLPRTATGKIDRAALAV